MSEDPALRSIGKANTGPKGLSESSSAEMVEENKLRHVEAEMEVVMYLEYMGGKASISSVDTNVLWKERFEPTCGNLRNFLDTRNMFAISGDNDCVTVLRNNIRKAAMSKKIETQSLNPANQTAGVSTSTARKPVRIPSLREKARHKDVPVEAAGKIAISFSRLHGTSSLETLQRRFRQLDYTSILSNKVLHVTNKTSSYIDARTHDIESSYPNTSSSGIFTPSSRKIDQEQTDQTAIEMEGDVQFPHGNDYETDHSSFHEFDLFVFSYSSDFVFVWWGYDMLLFKNIEKEFDMSGRRQSSGLELDHNVITANDSYAANQLRDLFPVWCTFELMDPRGTIVTSTDDRDSTELSLNQNVLKMLYSQDFPFSLPFYSNTAFLEALQRDHVLLPVDIPSVKQAISHALAQSAKLDIIEPGVRNLLSICKPLPVQIKEKGFTDIKSRKVNQLKGQLFLLRMELKSDSELFDEPEFFWDFPWFKQIFLIVREDYCIESRISLLDEKLSAVQLTLDMIGNQFNEEHGRRLEWIIIVLILIEILIAIAELLLEMNYGIRRHSI